PSCCFCVLLDISFCHRKTPTFPTRRSSDLLQLEDRGENFMEPGTEVYEGMIVGQNTRDNDLTVNITKVKAANNIRSATKEQTSTRKKPRILTLEEALEFINEDELVEVTPETVRLRKQILGKSEREKAQKQNKYKLEAE